MKSDYDVAELNNQDKYESVDDIKQAISESVDSHVEIGKVGYILPGHGMKGRKCELEVDEDLNEMYALCTGKRARTCTIRLWCNLATNSGSSKTQKSKKRKHSQDEEDPVPQSKRAVIQRKIEEVEDIVAKLKEKHGNAFKVEQLNAWAHMIQIGKHCSLETPPDLPYFVGRKVSQPTSSKSATTESDVASIDKAGPSCLSPGKRVHLRSECIDQLSRWHSLKESGGISSDEYNELRKNIIGDIGKF